MGIFGKKSQDSMLDVIRCDEENYLIWKWRPRGEANSTARENAIRWGSSLRVKDGEVAVFVYKQKDGTAQDFIEGPFDETLKTSNFPVLASILGLAYGGGSPFQAEVYFINLAGNQRQEFGVPYFDVFDPRFLDFPVKVGVSGSIVFRLKDYRAFIKLHRLVDFDLGKFKALVRDSVIRYVKGIVNNAPAEHGMPVLQIERKLLELNDLIQPRVKQAFGDDFGVELVRFDLSRIEVDKSTEEYRQLRAVTADLQTAMLQKQNEVGMINLEQTQGINAENMQETLRIQREEMQRFQSLQTQTQHLTAHQINLQADVLKTGAENLGAMSAMGSGGGNGGGGGGGGFNPVGMMTGMALGGAMGGQMANLMNTAGQNMQQQLNAPPPLPQLQYNVSVNGQNHGPFNLAQLQELARTAQLTPATYVWKAGMANWELAANVPELAAVFQATSAPPMPPPMPQPPAPPNSPSTGMPA